MCGIAGIVASDRLHADERACVGVMRDVLTHRGPDDAGAFFDDYAGLGHRRLSIVDLQSGHQPLANEDATVWIVFNGEIYNHADVRRELEAAGHRYRTRSDTETIVHAYEQWGDDCVHRFRGMFAFALWDAPKRRLLLARDRLGVKPLYWTVVNDRLIFGSEIKAILASGLIEARANDDALPEFLTTRYLSSEETLFRGIRRLMPGCRLVYEDGKVSIQQYWDIPIGDGSSASVRSRTSVRGRQLIDEFRGRLEESVRLRLMSDVPLGMFLSGGLDSSAIAVLMARMIDRPLQTFSVAFSERAFSELEYSRAVARAIGADAHEIVIGEHEFFEALPRLVWHEDEPIAHPSSVPLYFVSALAREHVKVVLTGEGSDELLAGYGKYPRALANWRAGAMYQALVPAVARRAVRDHVVPRISGRAGRLAARSFLAAEHSPEAVFFDSFAGIRLEALRSLLTPEILVRATTGAAYGASRAWFDRPGPDASPLARILYADQKTYLVELLMKQDQMSMAASIESRVPFLDHPLVEFAARLPDSWKLRGFTTKRILRAASADLLPREILERPKMGFPVPFAHWMRGPSIRVARDVLLDRRAVERGLFEPAAVERVLARHESGECPGGDTIWSLLNLELWYRTAIDGAGVQVLHAA
ncbi:MAG TPA: asparagine synthase (glutamine-hydrolyzing) [Vicinamibacterales bacterium]|jgi:asparagine synthase (glutamine-hydrolysing)|nr:asparagine synthase (glutamine-hydrolyzing) [Vicinamibacterales bacterium]